MKCNNVTGEAVSPNDLHSQYEIDYKPDEAFVTIQSRRCDCVLCCNMECSEFFKNIIFKGTVRKVADSWEIKIQGTFKNRRTKSIVGILNKKIFFMTLILILRRTISIEYTKNVLIVCNQ